MDATTDNLIIKLKQNLSQKKKNKITIFGCSKVGLAAAISLIYTIDSIDIMLIDVDRPGLAEAQALDLQHSSVFMSGVSIKGSSNIEATCCSDLIVLCYDKSPIPKLHSNKSLQICYDNMKYYAKYLPHLTDKSPNVILIVATYPFNLMTDGIWRLSNLPKHRIVGLGSTTDTAAFNLQLAGKLGVDHRTITSWVIGTHMRAYKIPVWKDISISGLRLSDEVHLLGTDRDPEKWEEVYVNTVDYRTDLFHNKGAPFWGAAGAISSICKTILDNSKLVYPVTASIKGLYGIRDTTFMSVPCVLGRNGIHSIIQQVLTLKEKKLLVEGSKILKRLSKKIGLENLYTLN